MSDGAAQESSEAAEAPLERQIDRTLLAESNLYRVPYRAYTEMSPRERAAVKARWARSLRAEAQRRRLDPDEFVAMSEEARSEARKNFPEQPKQQQKATARSFSDVMRKHSIDREPEAEPEPEPERRPRSAPVADVYDEGLTDGDPHSPMDDVPPIEQDPRMRAKPTLDEVRPVDNEDLAGWSTPRNLRDVYARFSIGDGQHFIRVERVDPKVWQQIPCAGYLGEIREPISEEEFGAWYGGRVYSLTVYGPDPKGRKDPSTGMIVVKAKTEPFRYTVPLSPPNLAVLPGRNPTKQQQENKMYPPMMPGGPMGPMGHMPTTPADANMFKTSIDFMSEQLRRGDQEREALRRQVTEGGGAKEALAAVTDVQKAAIEAAARAAEVRERALLDQLEQERSARQRLEEKLDRVVTQQNEGRPNPVQDTVALMQVAQPGKNAEEQVSRMREIHKEEMDRLRDGHREAMLSLKERHEDELKRIRDRLDDAEKHARDRFEELERRSREREKELRDQMDQLRRDERDAAERRVAETIARFEDRIKDIREQHNRELRMQEGQHVTRTETSKSAWEMQIANQKERIARLEEELASAREEAETNKDPVAVMNKAKETAEAMGYKKDENEPQTAWERFAGTAGMGLAKALETMNEWLPRAMAARGQQPAPALPAPGTPRMLPPGVNPQSVQQQRPRQPQRRTVSWATQGSVPMANQQPVMPVEAVQAQPPSVQAQPVPMAQPSVPATAVPESQAQPQMQPSQPPPVPENGQPPMGHSLGAVFPDEVIVQFREQVETAITAGMPADVFADRFVGRFPEPSAVLIQAHKPEDFVDIVKRMPGGMESVITRRDGKRWIEKLWQEILNQHQKHIQAAQAGAQAS